MKSRALTSKLNKNITFWLLQYITNITISLVVFFNIGSLKSLFSPQPQFKFKNLIRKYTDFLEFAKTFQKIFCHDLEEHYDIGSMSMYT